MGGLAPGKLKSRRGWPSSPRRLLHRSNFLDPGIQELTAGKTLSTLRGWRHSHRHRFAAAWPFLVRQNGPFFHRRRHKTGELLVILIAVLKARIYEIHYAPVGTGGTLPTTFASITIASAKKPVPVASLTPGTTYVFQVRAFGKLGYTDWSQPVQRMVI